MTQISFVERKRVRHNGRKIEELSGLSSDDQGRLWVVSDRDSALYRLDDQFNTDRKLNTDLKDLEGIAVGPGVVAAVGEEGQLASYALDSGKPTGNCWNLRPWILGDPRKKGIEGLCWRDRSWVAVTERPRRLLAAHGHVEVLAELDANSGLGPKEDCSGICWDQHREQFWLCSHEGGSVYLVDGGSLKVLERLALRYTSDERDKKVDQAEGITVVGDTLYIACDSSSRIYRYTIG